MLLIILSMRSLILTVDNMYSYTTNWAASLNTVTTTSEYFSECKSVATFYKQILLPMGFRNSCFIPIICPEQDKRIGILMIHRKSRNEEFTNKERIYLADVASLITQGCSRINQQELTTLKGHEQGLFLIDSSGKIKNSCTLGAKLLIMASCPNLI